MMTKTPGVYIEEISTVPPGIASVDTAIPAFIGYTDVEDNKFECKKIYSLLDFEENYCDFNSWKLTYDPKDEEIESSISKTILYHHMHLYFANGGGKCYIVSLGKCPKNSKGKPEHYKQALAELEKEDEPTIIVMPEAASMPSVACYDVYKTALQQAAKLMDRFVILDVCEGEKEIENFRNGVGNENLMFGAAYYPFLKTSIPTYSKVKNENIVFKEITAVDKEGRKTKGVTNSEIAPGNMDRQKMIQKIKEVTQVMSPSAAIAGVYASVDASRGVWKAPANVSLNMVTGVRKKITHEEQGELNIDPTGGKSINAIRVFAGKGIMVWGARTLAGNDNEWRYVPTRRFYNTVEESVKKATEQFVFEPNDKNTWVQVKSMIENFLTNLWRQGALMGATPTDAFFVKVGLGDTMTMDDILNGIMSVEIGLAVVRPAEFIILKFSHKLQE